MAKLGSITINEIEIVEVDVSPIIDGFAANDGSIAFLTDGTAIFLKTAGGPTAWQSVNKAFVGLGNADNTSDANKPVSTATQTALNGKANLAGGNVFTGNQDFSNGGIFFDSGGETRFGLGGYTDPDPGTLYNIKYGSTTSRSMAVRGISYFLDQMGIGAQTPSASAKLQIDSTTQGFLQPRMTSAQRLAIASPATGLQVYDTNLSARCVYAGTHWSFEYDIATDVIQTTTSSTYANITQLVTSDLEPGLYAVRLRGIMQSTATANGVGLRLVARTATISEVNINWTFSQGGAGTDKNFEYSQLAVGDNVTSASAQTANANFPVAGDGIVRISALGTIAIQFRSENNGTGSSIRPNSSLIFRKVSN